MNLCYIGIKFIIIILFIILIAEVLEKFNIPAVE